MFLDEKNSISGISHIHALTQGFLQKRLAEKGLMDFGSSHGNILFQLSVNPVLTMSELSKKINRDKSTTTVLVRKLENANLVEFYSSLDDKRVKCLRLTDEGKKYIQVTSEISKELNVIFYKDFSDDEKQVFIKLLSKIDDNLTE